MVVTLDVVRFVIDFKRFRVAFRNNVLLSCGIGCLIASSGNSRGTRVTAKVVRPDSSDYLSEKTVVIFGLDSERVYCGTMTS